jgi:hypothetical protein
MNWEEESLTLRSELREKRAEIAQLRAEIGCLAQQKAQRIAAAGLVYGS